MKQALIYIAGIVTGVILTILISLLITRSSSDNNVDNGNEVTMFEQPVDYSEGNKFKVFQVLEHGAALAQTEDKTYSSISVFPTLLFCL
jgi:hypothetical protein